MATQANLIATYQSNPTLQNRYTQQEYLDMFGFGAQQPTPDPDPDPTPTPPSDGIQNIIGQNLNQGGGYNPYAPNPNVNTNYQPNYDFRQFSEYGINPSTMDRKQMDMNQEFFYGKPPSGLEQLAGKALNFVPYIGPIKRGAEFLSGALKGVMPINQRAILENELRGSGVYTDDIGRIAIGPGGDYNTPEGIMAGYNANKMTDKTFDKRTDTIAETLQDKYGIDISSLTKEDIEDFDPNKAGYDLVNRFGLITKAKNNFLNQQKKAKEIADFQRAEKERKKREKEFNDRVAAEAATAARARARNASVYASADRQGFTNRDGGFSTSRADRAGTSAGSGQFSPSSSRGRSGYDDGGRVYLYNRLK
jgi:hypothetical protein